MKETAIHLVDYRPSLQQITQRLLIEGGFSDRLGGSYRSDATAWAILALELGPIDPHVLTLARSRLVSEQKEDGRVCVSSNHPGAFWPTSLAVLAWRDSPVHDEARMKGVRFLLAHEGYHYKKSAEDPLGHDTTLKGWSWIEGTHSWVEPTAVSVMALISAGCGEHARVVDAVRLIMDRQLPRGGWNYGNTTVFGQELHPAPESTGSALTALAGLVPMSAVQRSLAYLSDLINQLRTPIALGWSLLALQAWDRWPRNGDHLIERCLRLQARYGPYDTMSLSVLLLPVLKFRRSS